MKSVYAHRHATHIFEDTGGDPTINTAAGPPVAKAEPDPTKKPAPIEPPMAIMFKCLVFLNKAF